MTPVIVAARLIIDTRVRVDHSHRPSDALVLAVLAVADVEFAGGRFGAIMLLPVGSRFGAMLGISVALSPQQDVITSVRVKPVSSPVFSASSLPRHSSMSRNRMVTRQDVVLSAPTIMAYGRNNLSSQMASHPNSYGVQHPKVKALSRKLRQEVVFKAGRYARSAKPTQRYSNVSA